jgi:2-amino-4-hydroxy-6-hydroxymethyldihydropteridine diphosphokinase
MSSVALIGLGSNLGDRRAALEGAIAALSETPGIVVRKVSSFHETEPVGGPAGQGRYLNAAAALETTLEPIELVRVLQQIETRFGRGRTVRWAERTLDLDLLLFGDRIIDTPGLIVPHPRFSVRRFVLEPLADVAPEAVDPVTGRTIAQLLADLDRRPG